VIHLELGALVAAFLANFRAKPADRADEFAASGHETGGKPAYGRAVNVERDTSRHHFRVVFLQAMTFAMIAFAGAGIACIDAGFEFFVRHLALLE